MYFDFECFRQYLLKYYDLLIVAINTSWIREFDVAVQGIEDFGDDDATAKFPKAFKMWRTGIKSPTDFVLKYVIFFPFVCIGMVAFVSTALLKTTLWVTSWPIGLTLCFLLSFRGSTKKSQ